MRIYLRYFERGCGGARGHRNKSRSSGCPCIAPVLLPVLLNCIAQLGHIFQDAPGHLPDTPANRELLVDVANDSADYLGPDQHGADWWAETQEDGSQVWARTRNGQVIDGGLNPIPKQYNPVTGLSSPTRPGWH